MTTAEQTVLGWLRSRSGRSYTNRQIAKYAGVEAGIYGEKITQVLFDLAHAGEIKPVRHVIGRVWFWRAA